MKSIKIKSSVVAGLAGLLLLFPNVKSGSLTEITKPYLGEYECKSATLGEKDCLDGFSYITLELKPKGIFLLSYKTKSGVKRTENGKYEYDEEKEELTLSLGETGEIKRKYALKKGVLCMDFSVGKQRLVMTFEQK